MGGRATGWVVGLQGEGRATGWVVGIQGGW